MNNTPLNQLNKVKGSALAEHNSYRLPCRGCEASCLNYSICDGKPWRLPPNKVIAGK